MSYRLSEGQPTFAIQARVNAERLHRAITAIELNEVAAILQENRGFSVTAVRFDSVNSQGITGRLNQNALDAVCHTLWNVNSSRERAILQQIASLLLEKEAPISEELRSSICRRYQVEKKEQRRFLDKLAPYVKDTTTAERLYLALINDDLDTVTAFAHASFILGESRIALVITALRGHDIAISKLIVSYAGPMSSSVMETQFRGMRNALDLLHVFSKSESREYDPYNVQGGDNTYFDLEVDIPQQPESIQGGYSKNRQAMTTILLENGITISEQIRERVRYLRRELISSSTKKQPIVCDEQIFLEQVAHYIYTISDK